MTLILNRRRQTAWCGYEHRVQAIVEVSRAQCIGKAPLVFNVHGSLACGDLFTCTMTPTNLAEAKVQS